jgi:hypothetical protein
MDEQARAESDREERFRVSRWFAEYTAAYCPQPALLVEPKTSTPSKFYYLGRLGRPSGESWEECLPGARRAQTRSTGNAGEVGVVGCRTVFGPRGGEGNTARTQLPDVCRKVRRVRDEDWVAIDAARDAVRKANAALLAALKAGFEAGEPMTIDCRLD